MTAGKAMHRAPLETDVTRLVKVLERACTGDAGEACIELANLHLQAPGLPRDEAKARRFAQRACELKDPVGCFTLARDEIENTPLGVANRKPASSPAVARALELARAACIKDDGRACVLYGMSAGIFSSSATESTKWTARGTDLLEGSCLGGARDDCFVAAQQLASLSGSEQLERAKRVLERGCELDDLESCLELAAALPRGQDRDKEAIYRKVCAAGSDEGCMIIGKAERDGLVAAPDGTKGEASLARGIRIARARCDLGDGNGCSNLAKALPLGALSGEAARQTIAYLRGVCDRRSPVLCNELADAIARAPEPLGDPALVMELKRAACDYGYPFACPDPIAKLGLYSPLPAPIVDRQAGLEWAPLPAGSATDAARSCEAGFKLPTRKQLESLLGEDGTPRAFINATTPLGAKLLSSERAAGDASVPLRLNLQTAAIEAVADGTEVARCVRPVTRATKPRRPVLMLRMRDANLDYEVRDPKDKVVVAATIVRPAEAQTLGTSWKPSAVSGPVDVDVEETVEWALAARFLGGATQQGLELGRVFIEGPEKK